MKNAGFLTICDCIHVYKIIKTLNMIVNSGIEEVKYFL